MIFPIISLVLVVGVVLATPHSRLAKGIVVGLATALAVGATVTATLLPGSAWSNILSGVMLVCAGFAYAVRLEQEQDPASLVQSKCPFCGEGFSFHIDEEGKSTTCPACRNIFPNSADEQYLSTYAENARELAALAEGSDVEEDAADGLGENVMPIPADPIFGGSIQIESGMGTGSGEGRRKPDGVNGGGTGTQGNA